jgi:hypothetical protein
MYDIPVLVLTDHYITYNIIIAGNIYFRAGKHITDILGTRGKVVRYTGNHLLDFLKH